MSSTIQERSSEAVLGRVDALCAAISGNAAAGEDQRAIPQESAQAMLDAGLARILLPRRFGGDELGLDVWFEVVKKIAAVDASHGWCASLIIHHPHYVAQFPEAAQEEVWADGPDVAISASIGPACAVTPVDGGFRLTGRSAWASGIGHSDWAIVGGMLPDASGPAWSFFLVPRRDFTVEQTWDTIGMRGTGSNTIVTDDAFVPAHRVLRISDIREGTGPGGALHEAPYYRAPWISYAPATFVSAMLGAGLGALESFRTWTASRATAQGASVAGFASVQTRFARAEADLDAADLLIGRALAAAQSEPAPDLMGRARNLRDYGRASELVVGAVDELLRMSGSAAFSESNSIQRAWRDVHLASSHASLNPEQSFAYWGQLQMGIDRSPSQQMY